MKPIFKDYEKYKLILESSFRFNGKPYIIFEERIPYYSLYLFKYKIGSLNGIKSAGKILLHLNKDLSLKLFTKLMLEISNSKNGVSLETYSRQDIKIWCNEYFYEREEQPYSKSSRIIVFNKSKNLSMSERMKIINKINGRTKINSRLLPDVIQEFVDENKKITVKEMSLRLNCSRQFIYNYLTDNDWDKIKNHNDEVSGKNNIISLISILTDGDSEKIEILKEIISGMSSFNIREFF